MGCEVIVSGKLRGQRAKAMKFGDGYMIKTGHAGQVYTDIAVRHVAMRQGMIGIKVSIMLPMTLRESMDPKFPWMMLSLFLNRRRSQARRASFRHNRLRRPQRPRHRLLLFSNNFLHSSRPQLLLSHPLILT